MVVRSPHRAVTARTQFLFLVAMILIVAGCNKSHDEKIGGVEIPIPRGMKKSDGAGVEVALLGFGGGQSSFRGQLEPGKVIEFYEKEMPSRGWQPNAGVISKGGMLTYAKDSRTVIIMVGGNNDATTMTVTVGGTGG
jgi:hypothetical protein